ncbi:MAG TPA: hypothetical protein VKE69_01375 [Planctomycetota bacterium]|nr:hypothetical protein [Planctomycetota bacterium]
MERIRIPHACTGCLACHDLFLGTLGSVGWRARVRRATHAIRTELAPVPLPPAATNGHAPARRRRDGR